MVRVIDKKKQEEEEKEDPLTEADVQATLRELPRAHKLTALAFGFESSPGSYADQARAAGEPGRIAKGVARRACKLFLALMKERCTTVDEDGKTISLWDNELEFPKGVDDPFDNIKAAQPDHNYTFVADHWLELLPMLKFLEWTAMGNNQVPNEQAVKQMKANPVHLANTKWAMERLDKIKLEEEKEGGDPKPGRGRQPKKELNILSEVKGA